MASGSPTMSVLQMDADMNEEKQRPRTISRRNKALAAISSAAVTSLLMTPFDVVKTRIQTQSAPDPLFQPLAASRPDATCCQSTKVIKHAGLACKFDPSIERALPTSRKSMSHFAKTHTVASSRYGFASVKAMSDAACVYPDKQAAAKDLRQLQNNGRLGGLWDGIIKVGRADGVRGLWRGLTPTLIMTVPSQLTYMTCYDIFRGHILAMGEPVSTSSTPSLSNISAHTMLASLCAGAMARSVSATLVTPIELIRTRLQASTVTSSDFSSLIRSLGRDVRKSGPRVLFQGLTPTLYRDVPFSAIYFTGYESMKRVLTGAGFGERQTGNLRQKDFAVAFFSGATSGTLAAIITQPFDVIKTRLQAQSQTSKTTLQMWRDITGREGAKGLFRGLSPRVAKISPACGTLIATFELVGRFLDERW
jgi:hypothetical protein